MQEPRQNNHITAALTTDRKAYKRARFFPPATDTSFGLCVFQDE